MDNGYGTQFTPFEIVKFLCINNLLCAASDCAAEGLLQRRAFQYDLEIIWKNKIKSNCLDYTTYKYKSLKLIEHVINPIKPVYLLSDSKIDIFCCPFKISK